MVDDKMKGYIVTNGYRTFFRLFSLLCEKTYYNFFLWLSLLVGSVPYVLFDV